MINQALQLAQDIALNIATGPDKGISYKLIGSLIKIGRSPENDIVLNDVKSSRVHAHIEKRGPSYFLIDNNSQNGVMVNGVSVKEKLLVPGDQLVIGNTTLIYGPPAPIVSKAPSLKSIGLSAGVGLRVPSETPKNKKIIIISAVTLVIFVALLKGTSSLKKEFKLNDENALSAEIETLSKANEITQAEIIKKGKDTQQYAEAQAFYMRGFREFRENNYSRAIQYFETALTLHPNHPLAKRYLSRSKLKLNEEITAALERGEKYFQTQKYINAFNEYRTVLLLINDVNNKNAHLAQKRIEAIQLILMNNR